MLHYKLDTYKGLAMLETKVKKNIKLHENTITTIVELDIWDTRLMNSCLFGHKQQDKFNQLKEYRINIGKYAELCGLDDHMGRAFDKAEQAAKNLRDNSFTIALVDGGEVYTSLIFQVHSEKERGYLAVQWNDTFIPLISGAMTRGSFFYPAIQMSSLPASHYKFYLLLERRLWELTKGDLRFTTEEIREVVNKPDTPWREITRWVIKPTLKAIQARLSKSLVYRLRNNEVVLSIKEAV